MSKSNVLISLIKEVVKNEVKAQVKEEVNRLIKSGVLTYNKVQKENKSTSAKQIKKESRVLQSPTTTQSKSFTKNPVLNEILNSTQPFTSEQRSERVGLAGMMGGSVLDMVQRSNDDDWGEINLSTKNLSYESTPSVTQPPTTGNEAVDIVAKALNRNYSELVKRF